MGRRHKTALVNTQLDDLENRLRQFIAINNTAIKNVPERADYLDGQNSGFATVINLINQIKKRGSIWRGGYDDSQGKVLYEDQVGQILDERLQYLLNKPD